jgi:penicillin-binding protein 2
VYFETLGDRLKMEGLTKWYNKFGLGRKTGIGLPESTGSVPNDYKGPADQKRFTTWISAIGQGMTTATPLQMANVAATIGRGGIWVRPRLIPQSEGLPSPATPEMGPDVVDLGLPPDAIAAAKDGMKRVVNTVAGSAYKIVRRDDIVVAGKTGTAEVGAKLKVKVIDPLTGKQVIGDDRRPKWRELQPSNSVHPNAEAPWYRGWGEDGMKLKHSWFIGFAPADKPKMAFAVAVEYGGSGGTGAGLIAKQIVSSLIERQYLTRDVPPEAQAQPAAAHEEPAELLHPVGD